MNHKGLTFVIAASSAVALLAGCDSTTGGNPKSGTPTTGTSTTSGTTSPSPTATSPQAAPITPTQKGVVAPPAAQVLTPQNGYVFIATKSGKTRCQVNTAQVGCESDFTNAPQIDGETANGVRVTNAGKLSWVVGNLGAIPTVTIDYQTYSALGWIIAATADGTRFTNQSSGHGMYISTAGAQAF
jgi:hypothetical protein